MGVSRSIIISPEWRIGEGLLRFITKFLRETEQMGE
jgi:hypothetical protein